MSSTPDRGGQPDTSAVWCVVVAAGSGARFGGAKQFAELAGRSVLERSVATAARVCEGVVVVLPADVVTPPATAPTPAGATALVAGGATRSESVRSGLAAVPASAQIVLVHDAARPLASTDLYRQVIDAVRGGAECAVPVVEVTDTIRRLGGGVVDRSDLRAVQTPQGFRADTLRAAHAAGGEATDDAGLVEAAGHEVVLVDGEPSNLKVTTPADLVVAEALLGRERAAGVVEPSR